MLEKSRLDAYIFWCRVLGLKYKMEVSVFKWVVSHLRLVANDSLVLVIDCDVLASKIWGTTFPDFFHEIAVIKELDLAENVLSVLPQLDTSYTPTLAFLAFWVEENVLLGVIKLRWHFSRFVAFRLHPLENQIFLRILLTIYHSADRVVEFAILWPALLLLPDMTCWLWIMD